MKIKRPSEKHFSDGLFTVKPFTGNQFHSGHSGRACKRTDIARFARLGGAGKGRAGCTVGERHERFVRAGSSEKYFSDGPSLSVVPVQTKITAATRNFRFPPAQE